MMSGVTASTVKGALIFTVISLAAYSLWAFGGGAMREGVLYTAIAVAFVALSGLLYPLAKGHCGLGRFYLAFMAAFVSYAVLWCLGWFGIEGHTGEILGSAAGLSAFVLVFQRVVGAGGSRFLQSFAVLFLFHTIGYTIGGWLCYKLLSLEVAKPLAALSWGLGHGLGFGAGLGYFFAIIEPGERK